MKILSVLGQLLDLHLSKMPIMPPWGLVTMAPTPANLALQLTEVKLDFHKCQFWDIIGTFVIGLVYTSLYN